MKEYEFKITWYSVALLTKGETLVKAYSIGEAIDIIKNKFSYAIVIKAEYSDIDSFIKGL